MKITAAILIIICGALVGRAYIAKLCEAEKLLSDICEAIRILSAGISFSRKPLGELAKENLAESCELLRSCVKIIEDNNDFHTAWSKAACERKYAALLSQQEHEMLCKLGNQLGRADTKSELELLEMYREFFANALEERRRQNDKNKKLGLSVPILAGIFLAILVI